MWTDNVLAGPVPGVYREPLDPSARRQSPFFEPIVCCDPACLQLCSQDCTPTCTPTCTQDNILPCTIADCLHDCSDPHCTTYDPCIDDCLSDCADHCLDDCRDTCSELCTADCIEPTCKEPNCTQSQCSDTPCSSYNNSSATPTSTYHDNSIHRSLAHKMDFTQPFNFGDAWAMPQAQFAPFLPALQQAYQPALPEAYLPAFRPTDQPAIAQANNQVMPQTNDQSVEETTVYTCGCLRPDGTECGYGFRTAEETKQHFDQAHKGHLVEAPPDDKGAKKFHCPWAGCGHISPKAQLVRHWMGIHKTPKPYKCDYCDRTFATDQQKNVHVWVKHTHEKPYVCNYEGCSFITAHQTQLTEHTRNQHQGVAHFCTQCNKWIAGDTNFGHHKERFHAMGVLCPGLGCGARNRCHNKMHEHFTQQKVLGVDCGNWLLDDNHSFPNWWAEREQELLDDPNLGYAAWKAHQETKGQEKSAKNKARTDAKKRKAEAARESGEEEIDNGPPKKRTRSPGSGSESGGAKSRKLNAELREVKKASRQDPVERKRHKVLAVVAA